MKKGLPYKLFVSEDLGCNYEETGFAGEDSEGFKELIADVEAAGNRWYIEHDGKIHSYGKFQKAYIEMVLQNKEDSEDSIATSDDPMVKRVLEGHGIEVVSASELLQKMMGASAETVNEMLDSVPPIKELSKEDRERLLNTVQEFIDNGTIKVHDDTKGEVNGVSNT